MTSSMQSTPRTGANGAPGQGDQLQHAATGLLNQAARTADAQASTTMTRFGDTLEGVARAIEDASSGLRDTQPDLATLAATAATRVDEAATYLRDHNASDALQNIQQLARRQPALIVGGGLLLGLALGRFLRTGAETAQGAGAATAYGASGSEYGRAGYGATSHGASGYDTSGATLAGTDVSDELAATDAAADTSLGSGSDVVEGESSWASSDEGTYAGESRSSGDR